MAADAQKTCYVVKVCIVGDSGVGKSSISLRFTRDVFYPNMLPTLGAGFMARSISSGSGKTYKFQIWDTAGQERYRSLVPLYYHGAAVVFIVFDVTRRESLTHGVSHWIRELRHTGPRGAVYALVGNKADMGESLREVSEEEGRHHANKLGAMYFETSAKSGSSIFDLFVAMSKHLENNSKPLPCFPQRIESLSSYTSDSEIFSNIWFKEFSSKLLHRKKTLRLRLIGDESEMSSTCCPV